MELQGRDVDAELRLSLWSLEALYKMSNTLATSVSTVEGALADINREIEKVRPPHPPTTKKVKPAAHLEI